MADPGLMEEREKEWVRLVRPSDFEEDGPVTYAQNAEHYGMSVGQYIQLSWNWVDPHKPECIFNRRWFNGIRRDSGVALGIPVGPEFESLDGRLHLRVVKTAKSKIHRYLCKTCGVWTCKHCGHKRNGANRRYNRPFVCARCKKTGGSWSVTYHALGKWWDHNDAYIQATTVGSVGVSERTKLRTDASRYEGPGTESNNGNA